MNRIVFKLLVLAAWLSARLGLVTALRWLVFQLVALAWGLSA